MRNILLALPVFGGFIGAFPAAAQTTLPQTVMLELVSGSSTTCSNGYIFVRNSAGGTALGLFKVPSNETLVITDVDWQYVAPSGASAAGQTQTLRLFATPISGGGSGVRILENSIVLSSLGQGGASSSSTTGAVVDPRAALCVDVTPGPFASGGGVQSVIVRGTLVSGVAK